MASAVKFKTRLQLKYILQDAITLVVVLSKELDLNGPTTIYILGTFYATFHLHNYTISLFHYSYLV